MHLKSLLAPSNEYRLLALMLLALHLAVWGGLAGAASRSLMLAHLGLFLLWQPIWRREERLQASAATISVLAILAFVGWLDWWAVTIWLLMLTGLVGGRTTIGNKERIAYLLTLVFLVSELLLGAVPNTFSVSLPALPQTVATWGLPLLPIILLFMRADATRSSNGAVDFLYGVTLSLLMGVLSLGALLRMYDGGVHYAVALFQTTFAVAGFMLAISWLWMPFAGFSGLGQLWTRYLLNIGTPFEHWLARIAGLSRQQSHPQEFLASAMQELVELPWVRGVAWTAEPEPTTRLGAVSEHDFSVVDEGLRATVYTDAPAGTALKLHGQLLIALLAHFYRARKREAELTQRAHLEAVYETGARLTHDIKNLLQSLHAITSAMEHARTPEAREAVHGLLERQLPTLTQRLRTKLEKLQQPELNEDERMPLAQWWEGFERRHEGNQVRFTASMADGTVDIPAALFDTVSGNLLDNAIYKRQTEPDTQIAVHLLQTADEIRLRVEDTGSGVDAALRRDLLTGPVSSRSGFGIGLYQARRHAEQHGFELAAVSLEDGKVSFELRGTMSALARSAAA